MPGSISRLERFAVVGSTNDVVRGWLADGTPEVCVAVALEQTAGRGREGRSWTAPAGAALLLSIGFRPTWLRPEHLWRLAATVSVAMAEAGELAAALPSGTIMLKWPNDLVLEATDGVRKLAGVLGETHGIGTDDPRAVIGIGVNGDWPAADFPAELAGSMTSLRELAGRPVDHDGLLDGFLGRLERAVAVLREGQFDAPGWSARQVTTDRDIDLIRSDGSRVTVRATGVDIESGALLVGDTRIVVGEIEHVRVASAIASARVAV
ncbi:MAG TPA: biotin--[acetyl-CoA-carboxylase] ligase [Candidatus Limnocylindrales bacterium]|nr:biotin--[acetyl-CoA-carboxylase] ligase [Candidatus Limnocylindrales bacterium]